MQFKLMVWRKDVKKKNLEGRKHLAPYILLHNLISNDHGMICHDQDSPKFEYIVVRRFG